MNGLQGMSDRTAEQDYNTVLFLNRTPCLLELLEKFEAESPTATTYVVTRKVMQFLEEHSKAAICDKEASSLWALEVLILA
jgi:hypothetical protein